MKRHLAYPLAVTTFALLAGCALPPAKKPALSAENEAAVSTSPEVVNAKRIVSSLTSLTAVADSMEKSPIKAPAALCKSMTDGSHYAWTRIDTAAKTYNNMSPRVPAADKALYLRNLTNRSANLSQVLGTLAKRCPDQADKISYLTAANSYEISPVTGKLRSTLQ